MARAVRRFCVVSGVVAVLLLTGVQAAGADIVSPPGACVGSGTWTKGGFTEVSTKHSTGDVIKIPQKDDVKWAGNEQGFALGATGPRRDIDGKVEIELPGGGSVTIDSWGGSSQRYANTDTHSYDLPDVLIGVKMKLTGFHKDAGKETCSGSVFVQVEGTTTKNPMALAAIGGAIVFGALMVFAGRPKFKKLAPAFEDTNPG